MFVIVHDYMRPSSQNGAVSAREQDPVFKLQGKQQLSIPRASSHTPGHPRERDRLLLAGRESRECDRMLRTAAIVQAYAQLGGITATDSDKCEFEVKVGLGTTRREGKTRILLVQVPKTEVGLLADEIKRT